MSSTSKPNQAGWELIGPPECPILFRRELLAAKPCKVMIHRFVPDARDHDCHDHPRPFLTLILRGGYDDVRPDGTTERLRAPAIRYRRAEHAHITQVHSDGALTFVVMGPVRRKWGFWRDGQWWPVALYERVFGLTFRCERKGVSADSERFEAWWLVHALELSHSKKEDLRFAHSVGRAIGLVSRQDELQSALAAAREENERLKAQTSHLLGLLLRAGTALTAERAGGDPDWDIGNDIDAVLPQGSAWEDRGGR